MKGKIYSLVTLVIALALAGAVIAVLAACEPQKNVPAIQATAQGYNVPVRFELGGRKLVVANGGSIEIWNGGTLLAASGATVNVIGTAITTTGHISVGGNISGVNAYLRSATLTQDLSVRAITATYQISAGGNISGVNAYLSTATLSGDVSANDATLSGDLSVRAITTTGHALVAGSGTYSQVLNARGGIDMDGHDIVTAGDGNSWIVGATDDEISVVANTTKMLTLNATGANLTGTLSVNSQAMNVGKVLSATVANGGVIAHGLGAAPTYAICTPFAPAVMTATLFISGTPDATNVVIGFGLPDPGQTYMSGSYVVNCYVIP